MLPKEFNLNKYTSNISKRCVFEVDPEYPKELDELHNDCSLPPDKIEMLKRIPVRVSIKDY